MKLLGIHLRTVKMVKAPDWDMSWAAGPDNLFDGEDLFIWNEAVFNGRVLNSNSMKMAFTPVKLNNGQQAPELAYVMLDNDRLQGNEIYFHGGGLDGFVSFLSRVPDEKITIAVIGEFYACLYELLS